jgi:hypothetical protein
MGSQGSTRGMGLERVAAENCNFRGRLEKASWRMVDNDRAVSFGPDSIALLLAGQIYTDANFTQLGSSRGRLALVSPRVLDPSPN